MDKAAETTLPKSPGGIVKTVFSFIGKSILVLFAVLEIVGLVWGAFEESISFLEISTLEMLFVVVFFFLVKRYIVTVGQSKLSWRKRLYPPLRNIGWFSIFTTIPLVFILIQQESFNFIFKYENLMQIFTSIGVAICIYMATPKDNVVSESESGMDAPVEAKP